MWAAVLSAAKVVGTVVGRLLVKAGTYAVEHPDEAIAVVQAVKAAKAAKAERGA